MVCKICKSETELLFQTKVLYKHDVNYYQCSSCSFIQTEEPYWLDEAYNSVIASLDVGYILRNIFFSEIVSDILKKGFNKKERYLDFGGGYGMFVRLMRDIGFDFRRQDKHCENLFSPYFDITDMTKEESEKFELITSFEVFEHLENPMEEIEQMLALTDSILFSTELQPKDDLKKPEDWWYFIPETGQHIALYHKKTLAYIADKYDCTIYSNDHNLHLLTRKSFRFNPVKKAHYKQIIKDKIYKRNFSNPNSLLSSDFNFIKKKLEGSQH